MLFLGFPKFSSDSKQMPSPFKYFTNKVSPPRPVKIFIAVSRLIYFHAWFILPHLQSVTQERIYDENRCCRLWIECVGRRMF